MHLKSGTLIPALLLLSLSAPLQAQSRPTTRPDTSQADQGLAAYFRIQTEELSTRCLADIKTADDWNAKKDEYRRQLCEMLGLWPMPAKTDLKPVITGSITHDDFIVEKLQFQSSPGLYVTGNLYRPTTQNKPLPAILYVCGHAKVKEGNVSYGNKTFYQHHGEWFARNGYVCLVIDSLELGEIEGHHHGTYREGMWWWHDRGYTPAGVETWNSIRAIDYLCSRPEVDPNRIGMTGRSGGGAYTWYTAAVDERIKVAVPVAGITDLQNHIVDGCIEGHCDCMFLNNTYRWDFPLVAALVSPRALLLSNSDKDTIFPLDGIYRLHEKVRRIYQLQGADKNLGLLITEGPHKDTQDLQVPAFRWFNRFLKNDEGTIDKVAVKFFEPKQLRVFDELPKDQINTRIQETFGPSASTPPLPSNASEWAHLRDSLLSQLRQMTFAGWPESMPPLNLREISSVQANSTRIRTFTFSSQPGVELNLYLSQPAAGPVEQVELRILDDQSWKDFSANPPASSHVALAWVAPRGVGPDAWNPDPKKQVQIRRRFALLGQTLDGMRVWDVRRAVETLRVVGGFEKTPVTVSAHGRSAGIALYAALFEPGIEQLDLTALPKTHMDGPDLLNVLQVLDIPVSVALVAEHTKVHLHSVDPSDWKYPSSVAKQLGWPADHLTIGK